MTAQPLNQHSAEERLEVEEALLKDAINRRDIYETATRRKKIRELLDEIEGKTKP